MTRLPDDDMNESDPISESKIPDSTKLMDLLKATSAPPESTQTNENPINELSQRLEKELNRLDGDIQKAEDKLEREISNLREFSRKTLTTIRQRRGQFGELLAILGYYALSPPLPQSELDKVRSILHEIEMSGPI